MEHKHNHDDQSNKFLVKLKRRFIIGGFVGGLVIGLGACFFTHALLFPCPPCPPPPVCPPSISCGFDYNSPPSDPRLGSWISTDSLRKLNATYAREIRILQNASALSRQHSFDTMGLQGGSIGKCYVQALINSLPDGESNIWYKFGRDAKGRLNIALVGGTKMGSTRLIYTPGISEAVWCPTFCPAE